MNKAIPIRQQRWIQRRRWAKVLTIAGAMINIAGYAVRHPFMARNALRPFADIGLILMWVGAGLCGCSAAWIAWKNRCPHCRKPFKFWSDKWVTCPRCGRRLWDD